MSEDKAQYSYDNKKGDDKGAKDDGATPASGGTGGKPSGKYKPASPFATAIKIPAHQLAFDENYFLLLIAGSIALRIDEKEKIIDSIPKLSQRQVDELMKIFEEEKEKFDELAEKYPDQIKQLREKAKSDWKIMEDKKEQSGKEEETKTQVDDIKSMLKTDKEEDSDEKAQAA